MSLTINRQRIKRAQCWGQTHTEFPLASAQRSFKPKLSLPNHSGLVKTEFLLMLHNKWGILERWGSLRAHCWVLGAALAKFLQRNPLVQIAAGTQH